MYRMSDALGSLVPVAGPEETLRAGAGVDDALASAGVGRAKRCRLAGLPGDGDRQMVARCPPGLGPSPATSQRLMNIDATDPTSGFSPAALRRSMPRRYASAAATCRGEQENDVTLIGTPAKIASSIAGIPSLVPGILMKRLGRPARAWSSLAAARVSAVSCAKSGETSSDTQPSTPLVWS